MTSLSLLLSQPEFNPLVGIKSPNLFSRILCIHLGDLTEMAKSIDENQNYNPFPKKTGNKERIIDNPTEKLKNIQRRMNECILRKIDLPNYVIGGVKGRNPLAHPQLHVKAPIVITIDIKDCFPRLTNKAVFRIWKNVIGCSPTVARLATRLTTRNGHLPLGAPTSNSLANIALLPCVTKIRRIAHAEGFRAVSQYVDDQAISGSVLNDTFITKVVKVFSQNGFRVNREKIRVMRSGDCQEVTKRTVNKKVGLLRVKRKEIERLLYQLEKTNKFHPAYPRMHQSMRGKIQGLSELHPGQGQKLLDRLKSLEAV